MKNGFLFITAFAVIVFSPALQAAADVAGIWQGTLKAGAAELRVVFKVSRDAEGKLSAKMDSPDQGARDIPTDSVDFSDGALKIGIKAVRGGFSGALQPDGQEIRGEWQQAGMTFPLTLKRVQEVQEARRPQNPQKPYPYEEEQVTFENREAGITLAGTWTMPRGEGPFPAVILVSGSGPQDRDETIFQHKPFWVLADRLTREGFAVLRYDDRGIGQSKGNFAASTTQDFAEDTLAAYRYVQSRREADKKRIGILGHSEGGLIAPMVAAREKEVAFLILLAGPATTGEVVVLGQIAALGKAQGLSDAALQEKVALQKRLFDIVKQEKDNPAALARLKETLAQAKENLSAEERKALEGPAIDAQLQHILSPWYRYFLAADPRLFLQKVTCPVLALYGEKDLQVVPAENRQEMEAALKAGGNGKSRTILLPGLNHLFQTGQTGGPEEYGKIEETFSPTALQAIADWLQATMKK